MATIEEIYEQFINIPAFSLSFDMQSMVSELMIGVYDSFLEQKFGEATNDIILGETEDEFNRLKREIKQVRDETVSDLRIHKANYEKRIKTRQEAFIYNATLASKLELKQGDIVDNTCHFFTDFTDFDLATFRSYIYWRSNIRKNVLVETPRTFLFAYLCELCNFIEYDMLIDTWNKLIKISEIYQEQMIKMPTTDTKALFRYVKDAMISFSVLYGDKIEGNEKFLLRELENRYRDEYIKSQILNKDYSNAYEFIIKNSEYKIEKSKFYVGEHIDVYKKCLPVVMINVNEYFIENGINLLAYWIGEKREYRYPFDSSIIVINERFFKERDIAIFGEFHIHTNIEKSKSICDLYRVQEDDYGALLFRRKYTISYILWYTEKVLRQRYDVKPAIRPSVKSLKKMLERASITDDKLNCSRNYEKLEKVIELYLSDEFEKVVEKAIDSVIAK